MTSCEWCRNPDAEDVEDPFKLCPMHSAEYEGVSLDYAERRDAGQYAEYLDTLG